MKQLLNKCELEIYCLFHNGYGGPTDAGDYVRRIADLSLKVYKGCERYEHGFSIDHTSYYLPSHVWDLVLREVTERQL